MGTYDAKNPDIRFQIIGAKGAQKNKSVNALLENARKLESQNKDTKSIYLSTGWERGVDNKWKYDLNDTDANIILEPEDVSDIQKLTKKHPGKLEMQLMDFLIYPELYELYPLPSIN